MSTQVAIRESYLPDVNELNSLTMIARSVVASGLYNSIGGEQKVMMILLSAREYHVPFMQALNGGIWNIQGRIEISARLMSSMVRRMGHSLVVEHADSTKCILRGTRKDNGDTYTCSFSKEDAERAGLWGRNVWKTYPEDMLYARALSRLSRRLFSDVIGTAYIEGEIRDSKHVVMNDLPEEGQITVFEEATDEQKSVLIKAICDKGHDQNLVIEYLAQVSETYKLPVNHLVLRATKDVEAFYVKFSNWLSARPD